MARIALVCEPPDGGAAEHVGPAGARVLAHGHEPSYAPAAFAARVARCRSGATTRTRTDDARALGALARELRGFDLVHAHAAKAGVLARLAARLRGCPSVYTPHGFPFVGEMREARRVLRARGRAGARAADRRADLRLRRSSATWRGRTGCSRALLRRRPQRLPRRARAAARAPVSSSAPSPRCGAGSGVDVLLDAAPRILDAVPGASS